VANTDDKPFLPPTPEGLKDFAEQNSAPENHGLSDLNDASEDVLRGTAKGAALGFSDVAEGGAKAGYDVLKDPQKINQFMQLYRQHQQEASKANDASKARSPWLYGGGELAGGILTALASGGSAVPEQLGARALAGQGLKGVARAVGHSALEGAGTGAALGGVAGAGYSNATLDSDPSQIGSDALSGAATGGLLGGALGTAGTTLKAGYGAAANKIAALGEQFPNFGDVGEAFKMGEEGKGLAASKANRARMGQERLDGVSDISNRFINAEKALDDAKMGALKGATEDGTQLGASDEIAEQLRPHTEEENNPTLSFIQSLADSPEHVSQYAEGSINPEDAWNLRKQLNSAYPKLNATEQKLISNISEDIKNQVTSAVPRMEPITAMQNDLIHAGRETLQSGKLPVDLSNMSASDLQDRNKVLSKNVEGLLDNVYSTGKNGLDAGTAKKQLMNNMEAFQQKYPNGLENGSLPFNLQSFGLDPNSLEQGIDKYGRNFSVSNKMVGNNPFKGPTEWTSLMSGGAIPTKQGIPLEMANLGGKMTQWSKSNSPVPAFTRSIFTLPNDSLKYIGTNLQQISGLNHLGDALVNAVADNASAAKNAILFTLMQRPDGREAISKMTGHPSLHENESNGE
jgi:hypothetical protein